VRNLTKQAGAYRNQVEIMRVIQPKGAGLIDAPAPTVELVATLYAKTVGYNSREYEAAKARHDDMEVLLETRPHAGVTEKMLAKMHGRVMNIDGVWDPDGENQRMHISCREKKS
jgi:SPP1 family predicted phage head-tail adaptor